jgi:hypothetical protein
VGDVADNSLSTCPIRPVHTLHPTVEFLISFDNFTPKDAGG